MLAWLCPVLRTSTKISIINIILTGAPVRQQMADSSRELWLRDQTFSDKSILSTGAVWHVGIGSILGQVILQVLPK